MRLGVGNLVEHGRWILAAHSVQDVANRQPVRHDEDRPFRPGEDRSVRLDVTARDGGSAISASGGLHAGILCSGPAPVVGERFPLVVAHANVVQLGEDEARHVPPGEDKVGGLLHPLELARHAEVDPLTGERRCEQSCLLAPEVGQRAVHARVAVHRPPHAEHALAVPSQNRLLHGLIVILLSAQPVRCRPPPA